MSRDKASDSRAVKKGNGIPRRTILRGAGVAATAVSLAGCSGTQQRRYESGPVSLAPEAGRMGLRQDRSGRTEFQRTETVANNTLEITLINYGATYDGDPTGLAVGATPVAEEAGQELNPVVGASLRELVAGDVGRSLRGAVDLGVDAQAEWTSGPERVETTSASVLEATVDVETFVGVTDRAEAVVVSLSRRIHRNDAVFVGNGISREIEGESDQPLIAEEEGVFAPFEVDEAISLLHEVAPLVVRDPAQALTGESTDATTTPPAGSGNLSGHVVDTNAAPIQGATIEVVMNRTGSTVATTSTNAQGDFTVTGLQAAADYTVTADDRGYSSDSRTVRIRDGQTQTANLVLQELTGFVTGIVQDANANRIEGASVEAIADPTGATAATATTNAAGEYTFRDLPAETTYTISGDRRGYAASSRTARVRDQQTSTANLILRRLSGNITGLVQDTDANPIGDATVSVVSVPTGSTVATTTSDANGGYAVHDLLAETTYRVEATATGYDPGSTEGVVTDGATTQINVVLTENSPAIGGGSSR